MFNFAISKNLYNYYQVKGNTYSKIGRVAQLDRATAF